MTLPLATLVNPAVPWLVHMIVVGVATYLLAGRVRWKPLAFALAMNLGLAAAWGLAQWGHLDGRFYWHGIVHQLHHGKIASDPVEFAGVIGFCWLAPALLSIALCLRARNRKRPPAPGTRSS